MTHVTTERRLTDIYNSYEMNSSSNPIKPKQRLAGQRNPNQLAEHQLNNQRLASSFGRLIGVDR